MRSVQRYIRREPAVAVIYAVLIVVVVIWATLTPSLSMSSAAATLSQKVPLALVAVGETIVILTKGIDLSVGGTLALVNVIVAKGGGSDAGFFAFAVLAIVVAAAIGAVNGFLVAYLRLPSLIVTLATQSVATGIALYVLPIPGGAIPDWASNIPLLLVGPVPLSLIIMVVIPLVIWGPIRRTRMGTSFYAVGNDVGSAFASGIPVWRTTFMAYVLSGVFAALGGIMLTTIAGSGDPTVGAPITLNAVTAAALGGVALTGGRGTVVGALAGACVLDFITNVLFVFGVSSYWQYVASGVLLLAALAIPFALGMLRARRRATS